MRRNLRYAVSILIVAIASGVACSGGTDGPPDMQPSPPPISADPPTVDSVHSIPRLESGPHMGFIDGFDDLRLQGDVSSCTPNRQLRATELRDEAISRGMTAGRFLVDWAALEPEEGVYDEQPILEAIEYETRGGVSVFMTLSTLDSEGLTFPDYLVDDNNQLKPGLELTGPEVTQGLENLLNWLVPILARENVWALSLGNEPDTSLQSNDYTSDEILAFFRSASETVQALDPDLPTAVTLSFSAAGLYPQFTSSLIDELDIMMMNFSCGNQNLDVASEATWQAELDIWKAAAKGKPIIIQELTCPAGYSDVGSCVTDAPAGRIMATSQAQADFFRFAAREFASDDQLRAAIVFQLFDWSPELSGMFGDAIRVEGMPVVADKFEEALATTGLCRWSDATCREAWSAWIEGLELLETTRRALD